MAKEIKCNILKDYCHTDETEYGDTRLCEISWNNRPCTGVDIRKYDKARDAMFKGITVTYDGLTDIVVAAIENDLVNIEDVREAFEKRDRKIFNKDDYKKLFNKMNQEESKYERDNYGRLHDKNGRIVICSRRKG